MLWEMVCADDADVIVSQSPGGQQDIYYDTGRDHSSLRLRSRKAKTEIMCLQIKRVHDMCRSLPLQPVKYTNKRSSLCG